MPSVGGMPRGAGWKCVGMNEIVKRGVRRRTAHYWWSLREIRHTLWFFFPLSTLDQFPEQCFTPILASLEVSSHPFKMFSPFWKWIHPALIILKTPSVAVRTANAFLFFYALLEFLYYVKDRIHGISACSELHMVWEPSRWCGDPSSFILIVTKSNKHISSYIFHVLRAALST